MIVIKGTTGPKASVSWQRKGNGPPDAAFGGPDLYTVQVHGTTSGLCTESVFRRNQIKQNDDGGPAARSR